MLATEMIPLMLQGMPGRQPCLFISYGEQELHQAMDGGGSIYIEERFA
jgi:hypothetical protein